MEIGASEFKSKCLKLMEEVFRTREPLIITKRGKPIAKMMPIDEPTRKLFGCMKGTVTLAGDIVSPVDEAWSALTGDEDYLYKGIMKPDGTSCSSK